MQLMYTPSLAVIRIAIIALSNVCCVDDPDPNELTGSPEQLQQQGRHVLSDVGGGNNYRTPHSRLVRLLAICTVACVQVLLRGLQEPVLVVPVVLLLTRPHPLAPLRSPAECHLPPATCPNTISDHPRSSTVCCDISSDQTAWPRTEMRQQFRPQQSLYCACSVLAPCSCAAMPSSGTSSSPARNQHRKATSIPKTA